MTDSQPLLGSESRTFRCPDTGEILLRIDRIHLELTIEAHRTHAPWVVITEEMMQEALTLAPRIQLMNNRANRYDSLTGTLGELAFAQWFHGDWRKHQVSRNFGEADFHGVEIKCGLITLTSARHLIAKESYVRQRPADYYVQTFINSSTPRRGPLIGDTVFLAGWTTKEVLLKDARFCREVTRDGQETGIRTLRLPVTRLRPMHEFRADYESYIEREEGI